MYLIASIGPRTIKKENIKKIIESGANTIRFSFSHLTYDKILEAIKYVRENYPNVIIIGDLQGNKIRVSQKIQNSFKVYRDEEVYFCSEDVYDNYMKIYLSNNSKKIIPLNIQSKRLNENNIHTIYMKDGTMEFKVENREEELIKTKVKIGGIVRKEKGCNIPKIDRKSMSLTDKDKRDIAFAIENKLDILLYSYICYESDILEVKEYINKLEKSNENKIKLWGKIETYEAVKNAKSIIKECSGIVLGRGDLVPETSIYLLPILQKKIVSIMKNMNTDLIIATHILNSMRDKSKPTLNEVECIFNLISNKVNGFLLAGETSVGNNPYLTVKTLQAIINYYNGFITNQNKCKKYNLL